MPCTMHPIHFNQTKQNEELKEIGDLLTHELDMIREALLSGETPDFSAYDPRWEHAVKDARQSMYNENSGPSTGVLTNSELLNVVESLVMEYTNIKHQWRIDKCVSMKGELVQQQNNHRKEDLKRLMHTFVENGDVVRLRALLDVDPSQPLEPQLGYDPDEF